jgi:hypothetical protein
MSGLYLVTSRAMDAPDLCNKISLQCNLVAKIILIQSDSQYREAGWAKETQRFWDSSESSVSRKPFLVP